MCWTSFHGRFLAGAFERLLRDSSTGAMAFVRCLAPNVIKALADDETFTLKGWQIRRVADSVDTRTITADRAVEWREEKGDAVLLLVDTGRAGAGMDGIYSASREVDETALFKEARRIAVREIEQDLFRANNQDYAQQAIKTARGYGRKYALSRWKEFDFLCRVAAGDRPPGAYLYLLGLWPIFDGEYACEFGELLNTSRMFVDRLLGPGSSSLSPAARIESIRLDKDSEKDVDNLERFLHRVDTKPLPLALKHLAEAEHLWIGNLRTDRPAKSIQGIDLKLWRSEKGAILKWSGLVVGSDAEEPPAFILRPNAAQIGRFSTLSVKWNADPADLEKNAVEYRISVQTDQDEEIAFREVPHSARKTGEQCRFTDDDFSGLDENTQLEAKVVVSVVGNDTIKRKESEGFMIRFGNPPEGSEVGGVGTNVRAFSEG